MRIAVIGGGAAGFFAALSAKRHNREAEVIVFEKASKLLSKVRISGGGRCNVTHNCLNNRELSKHYPRGEKFLRKAFEQFSVQDTIDWFQSREVTLKTEVDNRMFPESDSSESIINALQDEAQKLHVVIQRNTDLRTLEAAESGWLLTFRDGASQHFDKVIVSTGGHPKPASYQWLESLGLSVVAPVPSLFTFNMPGNPIIKLLGVSVPSASVRIQGRKVSSTGPLLITHWGMSGPAILKLSALEARTLEEMDYRFTVQVNWLGDMKEHALREMLTQERPTYAKRQVANRNPFRLPQRLWEHFLIQAEVPLTKLWAELPNKELNRIINSLLNDTHEVQGKTTFKEEFVTAGGVNLSEVDSSSMQAKTLPGLYFAGEVLDIDGVTGGFNFQAAWTTGWIAGKSAATA